MSLTPLINRRLALVLPAVLIVLASCQRDEAKTLLGPSQALGTVLAEEAMRAAGANKTIALILPDEHWGVASTVEESFKSALQAQGFSFIVAKSAYLGDPMSRSRAGLQPDDFFEAMRNASQAGAVVSIAGAPLITPEEAAGQLKPGHPPILVVACGSLGNEPGLAGKRAQLEILLDAKIVQAAFVNGGSDPAAPSSGKTDATHELFARNYSILRPPQ
jgi:hypothetical protein